MDNLEALSDEELRLRLLQYGFPNLPVTASTRRILIKKLRNCVTKERGKLKNDTSLVTSFSSEEESDTDSGKKRRSSKNSSPATTHFQKKDGFVLPSSPPPQSATGGASIFGRASTRGRYTQNVHVSPLIVGDSDEESESFNGFVATDETNNRNRYTVGAVGGTGGETTNGYGGGPSVADLRKRLMMIRNETINSNRKTMNGPCVSSR